MTEPRAFTMKTSKWKSKYSNKLRPSHISKNGSSATRRCDNHTNTMDCECTRHGYVTLTVRGDMWKIVALSSLAAILLYINTIYADFAYDDSRAILKNQDLQPDTPISNIWLDDFWGTPLRHSGSHKSYRPLVVLTFRLNYALHQLRPGGYHIFNTILHAITTALYTITIGLLVRRTFITTVAGMLFAIHPIHTEAVAGIVGRADILCAFFFLLSILTFKRYCELISQQSRCRYLWIALTFTLVTASTLSKELGITVLGVCCVYYIFNHSKLTLSELIHSSKDKLKQHIETLCLLVIFGVVLLTLRLYFMGYSPPSFSPADNPAADSNSFVTRLLTFLYLPVFNFSLLVYPVTLSFDWSMGAIPLVESIWDYRVLSVIIFYGLLLGIIKYSLGYFLDTDEVHKQSVSSKYSGNGHVDPKKLHINGSSLSHTAMTNGVNCSEKTENGSVTHRRCRKDSSSSAESVSCDENQNEVESCFLPSVHRHYSTLLLSLSLLIIPFLPATNLLFYVGFVVAERVLYIPSMGFCLLIAEMLYQVYKKIKHSRSSRICLYVTLIVLSSLLGLRCYSRCLDWRSEEQLYKSGIAVNPAKAWGNLANVLNNGGDAVGAENAYKSALSHRGNMADVHYNLGILLQGQNRYAEALEEYTLAIKCRPRLTVAHLNKGIVLALLGRHSEAKKTYEECTSIDTSGLKDPRMHETAKISALYNLGRLYAEQKDYPLAITTYNLALERRPEYYAPSSIYNLLGEAHFHSGDLDAAERAYRTSLHYKADHLPAHLTMARLMNVKKQYKAAEEWYHKAIQISDQDVQNFHHYALYLAEHGKHIEALALWQKAAALSPDDFDITFNLASALRQIGRNDEAVHQYKSAVQLAPKSATAHMNLGAMYHINRNYSLAEKSYIKALELEPSNQVTKNNLKKLQNIMSSTKS